MPGPVEPRLFRRVPVVRRIVAASVALGLMATAANVTMALALGALIGGAVSGGQAHRGEDLAWLAASVVARSLCTFVREPLAQVGASRTKAGLRRRLVDAVLSPASGPGSQDVPTLAGRGLDALDVYVGRCIPDFVLAAVAPAVLMVAVGWLDWLSALILLGVMALFPIFGVLVGRTSAALASARWAQVEALGRHVADVFEGLAVLKAFGRSRAQRVVIEEASESLRQASMGTLRVALLSALVLDELASVSVALIAVPLGLRLLSGGMRLSAALAVLVLAPEVFLPLRRASAEFHESTEGLAAASRAMDVVGEGPILRSRGVMAPDPALTTVVLDGVSLVRPDSPLPALEGVDLTVSPGETVVVTGPNGAGKSTLLSVLLGFDRPSTGQVRVGGVDLACIDLDDWLARVAYLPDRPTILSASVADNLRMANPAATYADMDGVLAEVGLAPMIGDLPDGLEGRIGDGGRPLSAGERQRMALARVLLKPASLLLLDEPTVHLDEAAEALVVDALARHLVGRSAVIVTHRPAVLRLAHRAWSLDTGHTNEAACRRSLVVSK